MELDLGSVGSRSWDANIGKRWRQMTHEEKRAAITEKIKALRRLPRNSRYVHHYIHVLDKIRQLLYAEKDEDHITG
ncbi:hypothetical protein OROHE_022410 [Orobanche hederae]